MTNPTTPQAPSFHDLCKAHSLLADAHHSLHQVWMARYEATGETDAKLSALVDQAYAAQAEAYEQVRSHPQHPLNTVIDVPLAEDTTPEPEHRSHLVLDDYRAYSATNVMVLKGDLIADFRGEMWVFDHISRAPMPGKSAKVVVTDDGKPREFYAHVFNLTVR